MPRFSVMVGLIFPVVLEISAKDAAAETLDSGGAAVAEPAAGRNSGPENRQLQLGPRRGALELVRELILMLPRTPSLPG